jgi:hypothetical protein
MTADEFRELALSFPGTEERSHMDHPDFRVGGKVFASLDPKLDRGMAKLTPAAQQEFLRADRAFTPAAGKWGEGGATIIELANSNVETVRQALHSAWQNTAPEKLISDRKI